MIIAVMQAPINIVLDFLFDDVITAPTVDNMKRIKSMTSSKQSGMVRTAMRRASNAVRRMSNAVTSGIVAVTKKNSFLATLDYFAPKNEDGQRMVLTSSEFVRSIPEDILSTHAMVAASEVSDSLSKRGTVLRKALSSNGIVVSPEQTKVYNYEALLVDIKKQRSKFTQQSKTYFDAQWSWDHENSTFVTPSSKKALCWSSTHVPSERIVQSEIAEVQSIATKKLTKLKNASDIHVS